MDLNLEALKSEILDYLAASEFAVFHSFAGGLDGLPVISWDTERFPDYRMFLDTARKAGHNLVLFAAREFEEAEIDEAIEELEEAELTRDEKRDFERRIRNTRRNIGETCSIEVAFDHNSHLYVYEVRPDWYDDFLEACDEITATLPVGNSGDGPDGISGYYSNN